MKIGDYAQVTDYKFAPILNGFAGKIVNSEFFNGQEFFELIAENYGPMMPGPNGNRKVRAWLSGNRHKALAKNLKPIT